MAVGSRRSIAGVIVLSSVLSTTGPTNGYATSVWPYAGAAVLLLATGAGLWIAAVLWTTRLMHRPPRLTPARAMIRLGRSSPGDFGFAFEERTFRLPGRLDGEPLTIAAWHIPATTTPRGRCIFLHSFGDSRAGALAWTPLWHELGYDILLPDLRAHGDSSGTTTGGGGLEADDICAIIDELLTEEAEQPIIVAGVSFGACIAARVAAKRSDLDAIVLDSPVAGWADATRRWGNLFALPPAGAMAHRIRLMIASRWLGVDFGESDTVENLQHSTTRTVLILPQSDSLLSPDTADRLSELVVARSANEVWRPDTTHNAAINDFPTEYRERLAAFLADRV